jgi:ligand-binding sensor domain-containing protein
MLPKSRTIFAIAAIVILLSCHQDQQRLPTISSPKVVEAHGYVVPKDRIGEPKKVLVGKLNVVKAGRPKLSFIQTNVGEVAIPKVVKAGTPKKCTPGEAGLSLPKIIPAIEKHFMAGIPEVMTAQKTSTKDHNPQNFSSFAKLQGLKNAETICMLEDRGGNLWFGTMGGGVIKYDGRNFTHYTQREGLCNDNVWSIQEDKTGNLWFGTQGGVIKYDGRNFVRFTDKEGLGNNHVWSILEDKRGNLWFGTNGGGVSKYDGREFTQFTEKQGLANNFVLSIIEDKKGNLWFGTNNGLSEYDGKSFFNFTERDGLNNKIVGCMLEDKSGNLWFGTTDGGVSKYDGRNFTHFTEKGGLSNDVVRSIAEDENGNIWIGTKFGLNKYDGTYFTHFTETDGLTNNVVRSILKDRSGNLWFGTFGGGVSKYDGKTFTHFTQKEGLSDNMVRSIMEDRNGNLWFGTNEGAIEYESSGIDNGKKRLLSFTTKEGLSSNYIRSMLQDKSGNLWFGTFEGGLNKYDGKTFTHFKLTNGLVDNWLWKILEDKDGNIWSAGGWGVSKYDGKTFTNFGAAQGLSDKSVVDMLQDRSGNLWFGTDGGATKYDGKSFTHFTVKEGLSNNNVRSILEDHNGNVWLGTGGGGLNRYDGKTFTQFTVKEGLSDDFVESLMEDKSGNLWVGTSNGLSKMIKPDANSAPSNIYFKTYTYEDGFTGIGVNHGSTLYEGKDSTIWIGANDRLTAFHPEEGVKDTIPPNLQLTGLSLFNENIPWQALSSRDHRGSKTDSGIVLQNGVLVHDYHFDKVSKWYGVPEHLSLAYNNNYITFQFLGITLQSPTKVKYQYKLEGLDENWSALTNRSEATYGNLPHGDYTFKVKAMNGDGYWSEEFNYPLTIRPPWWETWWAYTLFGLLVVGFVYLVFRYNVNRIQMQHEVELQKHKTSHLEMQALRAQMNPHFIFNSLNSINMFILENNKQRAAEYLTKFSRLIRLILDNSLETFIPMEKELEALELYLQLESLRFDETFKYKITVESNVDVSMVKVPPLIIQPFAENAIWHGLMQKKEEGHLDIEVYQQEELLVCKITDDGIGRKKASELKSKFTPGRKSVGMRITGDRIAILQNNREHNTQIEVNDLALPDGSPGGTEVLLKIPVQL